jgi:methionyl-tRNA formyltransferase
VITPPDKPAGRNKALTPPTVKIWAQKNNIRVMQPEKISDLLSVIRDLEPDLLLVAAYGQIIPKEILEIPKFKSINIHGSLLPKYRGASPIQSAILHGEAQTGLTLIQMDEKMDHGPILASKTLPLAGRETFPELYQSLAQLAAGLIQETLPQWFNGTLVTHEQNHDQASFCKPLNRQDGRINWSAAAIEVDRQIRALNPEPGTWTTLGNRTIKILAAEPIQDHKIELPGKLYVAQDQLAVKCLDQGLVIKKVKPEGKNEMTGKDFLNGLKNVNDKIFI